MWEVPNIAGVVVTATPLRQLVHPLTQWFHDAATERTYRTGFVDRSVAQARISLLLGAAIYAAFGLLDPFIIPDDLAEARLLRYAGICPAILLASAVTVTSVGRRYLIVVQGAVVAIGGAGVIWFATRRGELAPLLYAGGIPLVSVYAATFMRLPFVAVAAATVPINVLYLWSISAMGHMSIAVFVNQLFFTAAFALVALSASYATEWHDRMSFLQRQTIVARTTALEQALNKVHALTTLLPMCAWCRKVRDDDGYWEQVERYLERHAGTSVSHSICPDCAARVESGLPTPRG